MTVLPSPIPHPLDHCPWQLPGWIYEALDWVVGVEWPEGNERAVWDLADEWYVVAAALAGPRDDAVTAAGQVLRGYGAVGAVAQAFDTAWRKIAEGDESPLPLLLAVSTDLGRLVEECGCDIEGAKLEVWIELGILVVELLALSVAVALTAGAASPAAAGVIAATRLVIQQIFRKLVAQLGRKTLKQGMREATERAAKQVSRDGLRGLGRDALRGGLTEAAEEGSVNLAIQGYQNSTGRRDGVNLADLGTSTLGGLAGGAAAPLAGLGKHASSRGGQVAEHLTREMGGEIIAEQAASLATGGGFIGLENAARAAASGATGSVVSQSDAALQARLDGRLAALAGTPVAVLDTAPPTPALPTEDPAPPLVPTQRTSADLGEAGTSAPAPRTTPAEAAPSPVPAPRDASGSGPVGGSAPASGPAEATGPIEAGGPTDRRTEAASPVGPESGTAVPSPPSVVTPPPTPAPVAQSSSLSSVSVDPTLAASPVVTAPVTGPDLPATTGLTTPTGSTTTTGSAATTGGPLSAPTVASSPVVNSGAVLPPATLSTTATTPVAGPGPSTVPPNPVLAAGNTTARPADTDAGKQRRREPPVLDLSLLEALAPKTNHAQRPGPPAPGPTTRQTPAPFSPEWYEKKYAADREDTDRRRYRGYYESQRTLFEDNRRRHLARKLHQEAARHLESARWLIRQGYGLRDAGKRKLADWFFQESRVQTSRYFARWDLAEEVKEGRHLPDVVLVEDEELFQQINDDVADLATGGVETGDRSALTGTGRPPSIDQSRPYGERGGLRPPLALHQTDLERQMPREDDGTVTRTADPRRGQWFSLVNDGGPSADATRGINCLDCTLSLYETWVHGRPRVSAPRTFDGYLEGDVTRPIDGEWGGPGRVERATGGVYQRLTPSTGHLPPELAREQVLQGYADLHQQVLTGGHGTFAFVINTWEGGGAHTWVVLNQNGTVLYLDPQVVQVSERPLYHHRGVAHPGNVAGLEALVVGPDGRPLPLPGCEVGDFSEQQPPSVPTDSATAGDTTSRSTRTQFTAAPSQLPGTPDEPVHPAEVPPSVDPPVAPTNVEASDTPDADVEASKAVRAARDRAAEERVAAGVSASTVVGAAGDLDGVFAAGVAPVEFAVEADPAALRRLVPHLDDRTAHQLTELFAEPRVRRMLHDAWRNAPKDEPLLAETLVRQLTQRPDLVDMVLATPELMASLTARPLTLHHLASHQQSIDVLGSVLADIAERGAEAVASVEVPAPRATPLTAGQLAISNSIRPSEKVVRQPAFDLSGRGDAGYRKQYLDGLYVAAAKAQRDVTALALRLAGEGPEKAGQAGWREQPKDRQRAEDKVAKYNGEASRLLDLAAAKVEFDSIDQVYRALQSIRDDPDVEIVGFEDRFRVPQRSGYRDIQLRLRMVGGHVAEFRLHLAALDRVAEWEHSLFEVRRDLDALAKEESRMLSVTENAIRKGILLREQQLFWTALVGTMEEVE